MRLILCCAALLTGCATGPTATLPIATSCVKEAPVMPVTTPEPELLAMSDYAATLTVYTERLLLKSYSLKASEVIAACR